MTTGLEKAMNASHRATAVAGIRRVAILRNPLKQKERTLQYVSLVRDMSREVTIEIVDTADQHDLVGQTERIAGDRRHDLIVVAGGDGTLLQALQGIGESEIPLTLLPLGTSNDYAKALGISTVKDAVRALFHGTVRKADRGLCSYVDRAGAARQLAFCSTAGAGLIARLFQFEQVRVSRLLKKLIGDAVWPILTVPSILLSGGVPCEIRIDDCQVKTTLNMLEVSKVVMAGGTVFAPFARIDGGAFDAWMVHDAGRVGTSRFMIATLRGDGRHLRCPGFEYFTEEPGRNAYGAVSPKRVEVVTTPPLPLHVHGDWVGSTPAVFEIQPRPLMVLAAR